MFKQAELKNFRQHRDLTVNFENGVVALRGANEAGKTTLLEAMAYCLFGAVALREPLPQVVTYGEKESSMKVRTICELNGVTYLTSRGKSGAEVKIGDKVVATGQTEVRKYWETLLGASWDTVTNLMLANQQALRGALSKGPSAAVELIEDLANFSLIDRIVALIQEHLPTGQTVMLESRISTLEGQLSGEIEDKTGVLESALQFAMGQEQIAYDQHVQRHSDYDALQEPARQAQARLDAVKSAAAALESANQRLAGAEQVLKGIVPVAGPDDAQINELRKQADDEGRIARAKAAHATLVRLPEPENEWEGTLADLTAERDTASQQVTKLTSTISGLNVEIARLQAQRITQTACGLCGKDLSKVPEVVTKNAELDSGIAAKEKLRSEAQRNLERDVQLRDDCQAILNAHMSRQTAYQQAGEFITLDHGYVPARWTWTGPDVKAPAGGNAATALQQALSKVQAYQRELGRLQQQQEVVTTTKAVVTLHQQALIDAQQAVGDAASVLQQAADATQTLYEADAAYKEAQEATKSARQALEAERAVVRERQRARKAVEDTLAQAKLDLKETQFNNDLLKRLREIRPEIATDLWNTVAGAVSQYFSDIRGTPSVFTRDDGGFRINGQSVAGLSGSTQDALGLAIRMALTMTFLPNTRWMVLDEPAAAADMDRETNMLGVVASSQFDQTIIVTHSDLIDSFATQVVRL